MVKSGIADGKKSALPVIAAAIAVIVILAFVFIGLQPSAPMPGSDRDSYGCVPSEGYTWCPEKSKCLRAWEESCASLGNLAVKPAASGNAQNGNPLAPGIAAPAMSLNTTNVSINSTVNLVERDSHGCLLSEGSLWCEATQKCFRLLKENCSSMLSPSELAPFNSSQASLLVVNDNDIHGCAANAGYMWCAAKQKCIRPPEETCVAANSTTPPLSNITVTPDIDSHGCISLEGYTWCESEQKCLRLFEENCSSILSQSESVQFNSSSNLSLPLPLIAGNDSDVHGCNVSAGYIWCEAKQKCTSPVEETCSAVGIAANATAMPIVPQNSS